MTTTGLLRYTVRFDYADGQHYDSGIVHMTLEQAGKVQEFLEALEKDERLSEPYVGEYTEWETPLEEMLQVFVTEFSPGESDVVENVAMTWAALKEVSE